MSATSSSLTKTFAALRSPWISVRPGASAGGCARAAAAAAAASRRAPSVGRSTSSSAAAAANAAPKLARSRGQALAIAANWSGAYSGSQWPPRGQTSPAELASAPQ